MIKVSIAVIDDAFVLSMILVILRMIRLTVVVLMIARTVSADNKKTSDDADDGVCDRCFAMMMAKKTLWQSLRLRIPILGTHKAHKHKHFMGISLPYCASL